mgnify:CR=1 FL=1
MKHLPETKRNNDESRPGNFDFTTVVVPAAWIEECNHDISWNNAAQRTWNVELHYPILPIIFPVLLYVYNKSGMECGGR